ncbi:hypothetical protein B0T09DRAFT_339649 [Sordaria sp. MPI-SDFR-AT-0083]|nr:hypothetical protein B0T09DRAFT_339649 [Sordaria sp. MPI-SDFR-AT-0083]
MAMGHSTCCYAVILRCPNLAAIQLRTHLIHQPLVLESNNPSTKQATADDEEEEGSRGVGMGFKGPAAAAATGGQGLGWVPPTQQQKEKSAGARNKDEIASGGLSLYHVEEKKEELSKEGTRIIWEQNIGNDLNGVDGGLMGLKQTVKGKGMNE